jgi:PleD family two-component response regulator
MQNQIIMEEKNKDEIILAAVDDMFFAAKIRGTGEALGITVRTVRNTEKFFEKLAESKPKKVIVDLHSEKCDPFLIAEKIKEDEHLRDVSLIGFFSHVHTELMNRAIEAGYDEVLPRSAFTKRLNEILK